MDSQQQAALDAHIALVVQHQVQQLLAQPQPQPPAGAGLYGPPRAPQGKLHAEAGYSGSAALDTWLNRMTQLTQFYGLVTDAQRVHYAAAHLRDAALQWWLSLAAQQPTTWADFERLLRQRFQPITTAETARARLRELKQGKATVQAYVATFNALMAHVPTMSEDDRVFAFVAGLNKKVQAHVDEIAHTSLQGAIERAVSFGSRAARTAAVAASSSSSGAPMELDMLGIEGLEQETGAGDADTAAAPVTRAELLQLLNAMREGRRAEGSSSSSGGKGKFSRFRPGGLPRIPHLSPEQVKAYMDEGKCFGCGSKDHRSRACPKRKEDATGRVSWSN